MDLSDVHQALRGRGFKLDRSTPVPIYSGTLSAGKTSIRVRLYIQDKTLVSLPLIQLLERPENFPKACAHLSSDGFLCYIGRDQAYLPRDRLGAGVLGCLALAENLIIKIIDNKTLEDTRDEFPVYWDGLDVLLDIPLSIKSGLHKNACIVELPKTDNRQEIIWILGEDNSSFAERYKAWGAKDLFSNVLLRIVDIKSPLGALPLNWPPRNLKFLSLWLASIDNDARNGVLESIKDAFRAKSNNVFILVRAINTSCAIFLDLKLVRNLLKSSNPERFMRAVMKAHAINVRVIRLTPIPSDPESWINRNLVDNRNNLSGRNIALIGCGAVGGFLSDLLAKQGAGFLGGQLALIDHDRLSVGNLGRHYLGFGQVKEFKADALVRELTGKYPEINVSSSTVRLRDTSSIKYYDLIIDATGNQGLSQFLSEMKVSTGLPPIIYSWVSGAGCGAQAYLMDGDSNACLHCLDHATPGSSFSLMRAGYELKYKHLGSCGEWLVPFSVPAAIHAAGLAAELAVAWVGGKPNPTLRSILIDYDDGKIVKPISPKKRALCPICNIKP
ncbi:ThiF family adenylyltransferase [Pseudomonas orientalis]|uniref:ThiF family adenylyltransferase n=1 Tax=Pseudomonas orientalis TaxID=76758 RepID=UPI0030DB5CB2